MCALISVLIHILAYTCALIISVLTHILAYMYALIISVLTHTHTHINLHVCPYYQCPQSHICQCAYAPPLLASLTVYSKLLI